MSFTIAPMNIAVYEQVYALWQSCEGIGLSAADSLPAIASYLDRNPGLSCVAYSGGELAGAALCGHDGRRGFIHHLAVASKYRRQGLGHQLVETCLAGLRSAGIDRCHIVVYGANAGGLAFWQSGGWFLRPELILMSHDL